MKVEELRIGSLIQLYRKAEDKEMSIHFVSGIENTPDIGWMVEIEDGFYINVDKGIEPIPLTEEWLLKFGLIKVKNIDEDSIWMFNDINFTYETERCLVMLDRYVISVCKYVHQLQNLYFDLTGEELIINL